MANLLGFLDMKQWALPAGIDATELTKWRLIDGVTYDVAVNDLVQRLQATNTLMFANSIYSGLIFMTTESILTYPTGATPTMERRSEYTRADGRKVKSVGHTLPLEGFEHALDWTSDYMETANLEMLRMQLQSAADAVQDNYERLVLTRFFSAVENQIGGGTGYDMPFANASSTVVYTPPNYEGQAFASSHTHFDRQADSAAGRAAAVNAGAIHLFEHGFKPPYDMIIPALDKADWIGLSSTSPYALWFKPERDQLTFADTTNYARFGDEMYIGGIDTAVGVVRVWATSRVPTDYMGMYKTFGMNQMKNPLAMRYKPWRGAGAILKASEESNRPLHKALIQHDISIGVNKGRLNGYAAYFAAGGSYTSPTIS